MESTGPGALPLLAWFGLVGASIAAMVLFGEPPIWARQVLLVLWGATGLATLLYYLAARRGSLLGALIASYRLPRAVRELAGDPASLDVRGVPRPLLVTRINGRAYPDVVVSIDLSPDLDPAFWLRAGRGKLGSPTFDDGADAGGPPAVLYGLLGLPLRSRLRRLAVEGLRIEAGCLRQEVPGTELPRTPAVVRSLVALGEVLLARLGKNERELTSTALTDPAVAFRVGAARALWALAPDGAPAREVRKAFGASDVEALQIALAAEEARAAGIVGGELAVVAEDGGLAFVGQAGALSEEGEA